MTGYEEWEYSLGDEPKLYCDSFSSGPNSRQYFWMWNVGTAINVTVHPGVDKVGWEEIIGQSKSAGMMGREEALERINEYFETFGLPVPPPSPN